MGIANKTHWVGVALLFAASILLLVTTISAPVWNSVGLLHVRLQNGTDNGHSAVSFGTFGYCILNAAAVNGDDGDWCTNSQIGYKPAAVMANIDQTDFTRIAGGTSDGLTNVMVLHPIECGLAFIAFLMSLGSGILGSFAGAMVALVAWVLTLISLAIDFTLFGVIHHHVNDDGSGSKATFGSAIWCLVAAFVCLFFGMIIVFFTCCANRREKKKQSRVTKEESYDSPPRRKKRFGLF